MGSGVVLMKIYFDSWWVQNHHNFQGITDVQAHDIWKIAQKAANNNQPCEWCNSTSAKIDSLENQLELAHKHHDSAAMASTLRGNDNRKLRNENTLLKAEVERLNALLNRPIAGTKFVDLRQLSYSKVEA